MSIFEILNETNHNLIKGVNANLESCANLRSVYDVRFINSLVKKKSYRNYLLWILASNKEYARALRREIDDHIGLTKGEDNFEGIDKTLKSLTDKRIEHTLTTLDLTALYRKGGFSVRYEPTLGNTQFRPDFEIHNENRVFFEVKSMFGHREIQKFDKVDMQIQAGLKKTPTSFICSLTYKRGFEKIDVSAFLSFARRSLGEIENLEEFPSVIYYPDEEHALVKMLLHKKVSDKEGYLAAVSTPIFTVHSARRVRDRIKRSVKQLSRREANIVIIDVSNSPFTEFDDLVDALFGDLGLRVELPSGESHPIRNMQRVFGKYNTRLSAVVFYEREYEAWKKTFRRKIQVVQNGAAEIAVPSDILSVLLAAGDT